MTIKVELFSEKKIINFYMPSLLLGKDDFLIKDNSCDFTDDLPGEIMRIEGVKRCLICADLVSVQYLHEAQDVRLFVLFVLDDFLRKANTLAKGKIQLTDLEAVEALSDAMIRPTLFRDKGDLEIVSLQNGVLKIRFLGHCAGCPYAENTLQNVVAKTLQRFMPQIKQVEMEKS